MRLSPLERAHLRDLALGQTRREFSKETVPDALRELVEDLPTAAYVVGARSDLLCWNKAAVALFRDFSKVPEAERNTLYQMFTAPQVRERYPSWKKDAREMLESFRPAYDLWSHSAAFNELVDELSTASPDFARWWKQHEIRKRPSGDKVMTHPKLGLVRVAYSTFQANEDPDLKLVLYGRPVQIT